MSIAITETRRAVLTTAHGLRREGRQLRDGRTWSQCCVWAWRAVKGAAAKAAFAALRHVRMSPSLIRSPIQRVTRTAKRPRWADFKAAYVTAPHWSLSNDHEAPDRSIV